MLLVNNRKLKKRYAIGGSGMLDSILKFLVRAFTSQTAKQLASSAAKEIGKTALDAGKTLAVKKLENIASKYTGSGHQPETVAIQDMVRKLNGSGIKQTF